MKKIIGLFSMVLIMVSLTGCSLIPKLTFNRTTTSLPVSTDKSFKKESCAGDYKLNSDGNIVSCTKGYYRNESNYNQKERTFTFQEKLGNWIRNLAGWGLPLFILACVFIPGFLGGILGFIVRAITSIRIKGFEQMVSGVQAGKVYVRNNGNKYTPEQSVIYNQGADDILSHIAEATSDPKIKVEINAVRARLGSKK